MANQTNGHASPEELRKLATDWRAQASRLESLGGTVMSAYKGIKWSGLAYLSATAAANAVNVKLKKMAESGRDFADFLDEYAGKVEEQIKKEKAAAIVQIVLAILGLLTMGLAVVLAPALAALSSLLASLLPAMSALAGRIVTMVLDFALGFITFGSMQVAMEFGTRGIVSAAMGLPLEVGSSELLNILLAGGLGGLFSIRGVTAVPVRGSRGATPPPVPKMQVPPRASTTSSPTGDNVQLNSPAPVTGPAATRAPRLGDAHGAPGAGEVTSAPVIPTGNHTASTASVSSARDARQLAAGSPGAAKSVNAAAPQTAGHANHPLAAPHNPTTTASPAPTRTPPTANLDRDIAVGTGGPRETFTPRASHSTPALTHQPTPPTAADRAPVNVAGGRGLTPDAPRTGPTMHATPAAGPATVPHGTSLPPGMRPGALPETSVLNGGNHLMPPTGRPGATDHLSAASTSPATAPHGPGRVLDESAAGSAHPNPQQLRDHRIQALDNPRDVTTGGPARTADTGSPAPTHTPDATATAAAAQHAAAAPGAPRGPGRVLDESAAGTAHPTPQQLRDHRIQALDNPRDLTTGGPARTVDPGAPAPTPTRNPDTAGAAAQHGGAAPGASRGPGRVLDESAAGTARPTPEQLRDQRIQALDTPPAGRSGPAGTTAAGHSDRAAATGVDARRLDASAPPTPARADAGGPRSDHGAVPQRPDLAATEHGAVPQRPDPTGTRTEHGAVPQRPGGADAPIPAAKPRPSAPVPGRQLLQNGPDGRTDLVRVSAEPMFAGEGRRLGGRPNPVADRPVAEPGAGRPPAGAETSYSYTELRADGTMGPTTLRPGENVLHSQPLTGRGNGGERILSYSADGRSWGIEPVAPSPRPAAGADPRPRQLLRQNPDGTVDLLTFEKPPASPAGPPAKPRPGEASYHDLDGPGAGRGWQSRAIGPSEKFTAEQVSKPQSTGQRLDGKELFFTKEPTSLLVKDQSTHLWTPLGRTDGAAAPPKGWGRAPDATPVTVGRPDKPGDGPAFTRDGTGPATPPQNGHYRLDAATGAVEPVKVRATTLDVAEIGTQTRSVTIDRYAATGGRGGGSEIGSLRLLPDGTLGPANPRAITPDQLRYDSASGSITMDGVRPSGGRPSGGDGAGSGPGGGAPAPRGGGGVAGRGPSHGSATQTDDGALTFVKQPGTTHSSTAAPPRDSRNQAGAPGERPDPGRTLGTGKPATKPGAGLGGPAEAAAARSLTRTEDGQVVLGAPAEAPRNVLRKPPPARPTAAEAHPGATPASAPPHGGTTAPRPETTTEAAAPHAETTTGANAPHSETTAQGTAPRAENTTPPARATAPPVEATGPAADRATPAASGVPTRAPLPHEAPYVTAMPEGLSMTVRGNVIHLHTGTAPTQLVLRPERTIVVDGSVTSLRLIHATLDALRPPHVAAVEFRGTRQPITPERAQRIAAVLLGGLPGDPYVSFRADALTGPPPGVAPATSYRFGHRPPDGLEFPDAPRHEPSAGEGLPDVPVEPELTRVRQLARVAGFDAGLSGDEVDAVLAQLDHRFGGEVLGAAGEGEARRFAVQEIALRAGVDRETARRHADAVGVAQVPAAEAALAEFRTVIRGVAADNRLIDRTVDLSISLAESEGVRYTEATRAELVRALRSGDAETVTRLRAELDRARADRARSAAARDTAALNELQARLDELNAASVRRAHRAEADRVAAEAARERYRAEVVGGLTQRFGPRDDEDGATGPSPAAALGLRPVTPPVERPLTERIAETPPEPDALPDLPEVPRPDPRGPASDERLASLPDAPVDKPAPEPAAEVDVDQELRERVADLRIGEAERFHAGFLAQWRERLVTALRDGDEQAYQRLTRELDAIVGERREQVSAHDRVALRELERRLAELKPLAEELTARQAAHDADAEAARRRYRDVLRELTERGGGGLRPVDPPVRDPIPPVDPGADLDAAGVRSRLDDLPATPSTAPSPRADVTGLFGGLPAIEESPLPYELAESLAAEAGLGADVTRAVRAAVGERSGGTVVTPELLAAETRAIVLDVAGRAGVERAVAEAFAREIVAADTSVAALAAFRAELRGRAVERELRRRVAEGIADGSDRDRVLAALESGDAAALTEVRDAAATRAADLRQAAEFAERRADESTADRITEMGRDQRRRAFPPVLSELRSVRPERDGEAMMPPLARPRSEVDEQRFTEAVTAEQRRHTAGLDADSRFTAAVERWRTDHPGRDDALEPVLATVRAEFEARTARAWRRLWADGDRGDGWAAELDTAVAGLPALLDDAVARGARPAPPPEPPAAPVDGDATARADDIFRRVVGSVEYDRGLDLPAAHLDAVRDRFRSAMRDTYARLGAGDDWNAYVSRQWKSLRADLIAADLAATAARDAARAFHRFLGDRAGRPGALDATMSEHALRLLGAEFARDHLALHRQHFVGLEALQRQVFEAALAELRDPPDESATFTDAERTDRWTARRDALRADYAARLGTAHRVESHRPDLLRDFGNAVTDAARRTERTPGLRSLDGLPGEVRDRFRAEFLAVGRGLFDQVWAPVIAAGAREFDPAFQAAEHEWQVRYEQLLTRLRDSAFRYWQAHRHDDAVQDARDEDGPESVVAPAGTGSPPALEAAPTAYESAARPFTDAARADIGAALHRPGRNVDDDARQRIVRELDDRIEQADAAARSRAERGGLTPAVVAAAVDGLRRTLRELVSSVPVLLLHHVLLADQVRAAGEAFDELRTVELPPAVAEALGRSFTLDWLSAYDSLYRGARTPAAALTGLRELADTVAITAPEQLLTDGALQRALLEAAATLPGDVAEVPSGILLRPGATGPVAADLLTIASSFPPIPGHRRVFVGPGVNVGGFLGEVTGALGDPAVRSRIVVHAPLIPAEALLRLADRLGVTVALTERPTDPAVARRTTPVDANGSPTSSSRAVQWHVRPEGSAPPAPSARAVPEPAPAAEADTPAARLMGYAHRAARGEPLPVTEVHAAARGLSLETKAELIDDLRELAVAHPRRRAVLETLGALILDC